MVDETLITRVEEEAAKFREASMPTSRSRISEMLETIVRLRVAGTSWVGISIALERSGIRQPNGSVYSAARLCEIFSVLKGPALVRARKGIVAKVNVSESLDIPSCTDISTSHPLPSVLVDKQNPPSQEDVNGTDDKALEPAKKPWTPPKEVEKPTKGKYSFTPVIHNPQPSYTVDTIDEMRNHTRRDPKK